MVSKLVGAGNDPELGQGGATKLPEDILQALSHILDPAKGGGAKGKSTQRQHRRKHSPRSPTTPADYTGAFPYNP